MIKLRWEQSVHYDGYNGKMRNSVSREFQENVAAGDNGHKNSWSDAPAAVATETTAHTER